MAKDDDSRIRVLIADDHALIRKEVRRTLEDDPRFEVVAEAEDGVQAVDRAKKFKPDVVVLDVTMPNMSGFEAARNIKSSLPSSAIVILSAYSNQIFVEEAKAIGVRAYVTKTKATYALVKAIDAALQGDEFYVVD